MAAARPSTDAGVPSIAATVAAGQDLLVTRLLQAEPNPQVPQMKRSHTTALVAALFVWQLVNWLQVLEGCDLSYSQPITALSLILVLVLSALYLGESVDTLKVLGIGFVFAGVWFISRTDHAAPAKPNTPPESDSATLSINI